MTGSQGSTASLALMLSCCRYSDLHTEHSTLTFVLCCLYLQPLLFTSSIVCCYHIHNLELVQAEHSPSAPLSIQCSQPACLSEEVSPQKGEAAAMCSLLHIPPEELHTVFSEKPGSWDWLTPALLQTTWLLDFRTWTELQRGRRCAW